MSLSGLFGQFSHNGGTYILKHAMASRTIFPPLKRKRFESVQFAMHVPNGFSAIKQYWTKKGKAAEGRTFVHFLFYKRENQTHTVLLSAERTHKGCANLRIFLFPDIPSNVGLLRRSKQHRITQTQFLGLFRTLIERGQDLAPLPIAFGFRRRVRLTSPLFDHSETANLYVQGISLRGSPSAPLHQVSVKEEEDGTALLDVSSKPVYQLHKDFLDARMFATPMRDIDRLSKALITRIHEQIYAKPFARLTPRF